MITPTNRQILQASAVLAKELEMELEDAELVPVHVERAAAEERALQQAPVIQSFPLDEDGAAEFLAEEFCWGETGLEFLARFGSSPAGISEIMDRMNSDTAAWLPRIREAIHRACCTGLLTITLSGGRELYSLTEGVDISSLLGARTIDRCPLNETAATGFLSETFSSRGTDYLKPISGKRFLSLFEHGYTLTDLFTDHRLYTDDEVNFGPAVRTFMTGLVNAAFECGLLERRYGSKPGYPNLQEVYYPSADGRNLSRRRRREVITVGHN